MYENVMVAIDNSECSGYAVELAVNLARAMGARLTGNHVYAARLHDQRFRQLEPGLPEQYQSAEVLQHWRNVHGDLIGRGLRIISDSYLDLFEEKCNQAGVTAERKTPEGRNYEELAKDAHESGYDLVVIGAHGLGRIECSMLGSVCERVTRLVNCDVLVTRNDRPLESGKVVVAIDGSPDSFAALRRAFDISRVLGNKVVAAAAYDPFFHRVTFGNLAKVLTAEAARLFRFVEQEKLHDEVIDKGLAKVYGAHLQQAQTMAKKRDVSLEIEVLTGKPYDAIVSFVERLHPSLLLVGGVGIHHADGVTLGSTVENLLRLADCNVLIARESLAKVYV